MGEIDDETLIEGAIKGYVSALGDPYTTYYTKEEMDELMEETTGNYVGIGIYMTLDLENNAIYVVKPMEGSPAEEAGIKSRRFNYKGRRNRIFWRRVGPSI